MFLWAEIKRWDKQSGLKNKKQTTVNSFWIRSSTHLQSVLLVWAANQKTAGFKGKGKGAQTACCREWMNWGAAPTPSARSTRIIFNSYREAYVQVQEGRSVITQPPAFPGTRLLVYSFTSLPLSHAVKLNDDIIEAVQSSSCLHFAYFKSLCFYVFLPFVQPTSSPSPSSSSPPPASRLQGVLHSYHSLIAKQSDWILYLNKIMLISSNWFLLIEQNSSPNKQKTPFRLRKETQIPWRFCQEGHPA